MEPVHAVKHIADLIKQSKSTIVFTGAGVSTESGLPDFRSGGGLWEGQDPMVVAHASTVRDNPDMIARFYRDRIIQYRQHRPNRGHEILAEWETQGKIWGVVTQNIDGYHQRAGSKNVLELHGNMDLYCNYCLYECDSYPEYEHFWLCPCVSDTSEGMIPCGGVIRPKVTLFGEELPQRPYHRALQRHAEAKLCIILGSSCSVYPANSLPQHTITNGGEVVIINQSATDLDYLASYKISELSISKALESINTLLEDDK